MKMCQPHWDLCRKAVDDRGMSSLVAKSGKEAADNAMEELRGGDPAFDPLMALNNHFWSEALRCGGLYLMSVDAEANPVNEGHYCPICEFEKHSQGFVAEEAVGNIADQMTAFARSEGLIPEVQ